MLSKTLVRPFINECDFLDIGLNNWLQPSKWNVKMATIFFGFYVFCISLGAWEDVAIDSTSES